MAQHASSVWFISLLPNQLDVEADLDLVTHGDASGFEHLVPGQLEVAPPDLGGGFEPRSLSLPWVALPAMRVTSRITSWWSRES